MVIFYDYELNKVRRSVKVSARSIHPQEQLTK